MVQRKVKELQLLTFCYTASIMKVIVFVPMIITVLLTFIVKNHCQLVNSTACQQAGIRFSTAPVEPYLKVKEGGTAIIFCNFSTIVHQNQLPIPFWRRVQRKQIDPDFLYYGQFPADMHYNESASALLIENVSNDINGTSIACCFAASSLDTSSLGICINNSTTITVVTSDARTSYRPEPTTAKAVSKTVVIKSSLSWMFAITFFNYWF